MRILVTGASGFIGRQVVAGLLSRGADHELVLVDPVPAIGTDGRVRVVTGDATDPALLAGVFAEPVDAVFALGATLTAAAEADFEAGYRVNTLGFLALLEACRRSGRRPRVIYPSSLAAFGGRLPEIVDDAVARTPETSYGTQKAIAELLLADYTRRGFLDGRALRLPIVVTRPGPPAPVISDRLASLLREPLRGQDTICPWRPDTLVPLASVQAVAAALVRMGELPVSPGAVNLHVTSARVGDLVEAARRRGATGRVSWQPDEKLQAIVDAWPHRFESARARELGLVGETSVDAIIDRFLEQEGLK